MFRVAIEFLLSLDDSVDKSFEVKALTFESSRITYTFGHVMIEPWYLEVSFRRLMKVHIVIHLLVLHDSSSIPSSYW